VTTNNNDGYRRPFWRSPLELPPDSPLARAVDEAVKAFKHDDIAGGDEAYRKAVGLAVWEPTIARRLAADHVAQLSNHRQWTLAAKRADEYLGKADPYAVALKVASAVAYSGVGYHDRAETLARQVRADVADRLAALPVVEDALLHRVEAWTAMNRHDLAAAQRHLQVASGMFLEAGDIAGTEAIQTDLQMLEQLAGRHGLLSNVDNIGKALWDALALKRDQRYDEAIKRLTPLLSTAGLDPTIRIRVLTQLVVLYRMTRQFDEADALRQPLVDAAAESADPEKEIGTIRRLWEVDEPGPFPPPRPDVPDGLIEFDEQGQPQARGDLAAERAMAELAEWHLRVGEWEVTVGRRDMNVRSQAWQSAIGHLRKAIAYAAAPWLVEIRVAALRLLGDAFDMGKRKDQAVRCWHKAHALENEIAGKQDDDRIRAQMLHAVRSEFDELIDSAVRAMKVDPAAAALIVTAIEASRGVTEGLPDLGDVDDAYRWTTSVGESLPKSQLAWMIHPADSRIHHILLGRGLFYYDSVPASRSELSKRIESLTQCWRSDHLFQLSVKSGAFRTLLDEVTEMMGIARVVTVIPESAQRIVLVLGGRLSDVPIAGMRLDDDLPPLGLRYALSEVPNLSCLDPLRGKARRSRRDSVLLVSPLGAEFVLPEHARWRTVLSAEHATATQLRAKLTGRRRWGQVRLNCHGHHDTKDGTRSWLQLSPEGQDGRLTAEQLQTMNLQVCSTLVLGACESGMAHRLGRHQELGFVRAGLNAGAASVVAARWRAPASVGTPILERFEGYARYLPRDVALQRARQDVCAGMATAPSEDIPADHPACWACWAVYGDSGRQTRTGLLRRTVRRLLHSRRNHGGTARLHLLRGGR
jgi:tetratricopeptide (TPR) repeat protein